MVRDTAGEGVPWAAVAFVHGPVDLPEIAAITRGDGTFALTAPVAGEYRISCRADEFDYQEVDVVVTDTDVSVTVELNDSELPAAPPEPSDRVNPNPSRSEKDDES